MKFITALLTIAVLCSPAASAHAGVTYVKQDSPGPTFDGTSWDTAYHTVQAGVDAAVSGDSVWVAAGVYPESVNLKAGVLLLGGYSGLDTTRDFRTYTSKIISCNMLGAGTLEGFTIEGGTDSGVTCFSATVRSNIITGTQRCGVNATGAAIIQGNTITNYTLACLGNCYGIYVSGLGKIIGNRVHGQDIGISSTGSICDNVVYKCHMGIEAGAISQSVSCDNNLVYGSDVGIRLPGQSGMPSVKNNIVVGNSFGISSVSGGTVGTNDVCGNRVNYNDGQYNWHPTDISADPKLENPDAGDFRLAPNSPCIDKGLWVPTDPNTDIAGHPRVYNSKVDIGPYEFQPEERLSLNPSAGVSLLIEPGGSTGGATRTYTLYNVGTASISWTASKTASWIDLTSDSGAIDPGGSATVAVSINATASTLPAGRYADTVTFNDITNNEAHPRIMDLVIGTVRYVNPAASGSVHDGASWDSAYFTINDALNAAVPGQEIRVAGGTYVEWLDMTKNVTLKGGYISGPGDVRDTKLYETTIQRSGDYGDTITVESPCTIDGFTITGGYDGLYGLLDSAVVVNNCVLKGNTNSGTTLQYAHGTVSACKVTGNRYGLELLAPNSTAVNNLVYGQSITGITLSSGTAAVNNTLVGNSTSGLSAPTGSTSLNNLDFGAVWASSPFVNAAAGDYHLRASISGGAIDYGVNDGAPSIDMDGIPRPQDGNGDGVAKTDLGCYEFGVMNPATISQAKSFSNGVPVGIMCPVVTAILPDRFYVENRNRIGGIGVIGTAPAVGTMVAVEGNMDVVDGEKIIRASIVTPGFTTTTPKPLLMNPNSLGGGPLGLQSGVKDWRLVKKIDSEGKPYYVRELFQFGGANNIGLLVKMVGRVSNSSLDHFYLDGNASFDDGDAAAKGVRVDWPFGAPAPADGGMVTVLGISSCRVVHDDVLGDVVVRMLRPVSAGAVVLQ